jgi:hypothetical protein
MSENDDIGTLLAISIVFKTAHSEVHTIEERKQWVK